MECEICLDNYVRSVKCNQCKKEICGDCFIRIITDENDFTCPYCRWYDSLTAYGNVLDDMSVFTDKDIAPDIKDGGYYIIASHIMVGDYETELLNYYMDCIRKTFLKKHSFMVGKFINKLEDKLYEFDRYQYMKYIEKHKNNFNDTLNLLNMEKLKTEHKNNFKKVLNMIEIKAHIFSCKTENYKNNYFLIKCDNNYYCQKCIYNYYCNKCIYNIPCGINHNKIMENKESINKNIGVTMRHVPRSKVKRVQIINVNDLL